VTTSLHRIKASLDLPPQVPAMVIKAYAIVGKMDGSPWFPNPVPSLAKVRASIDALNHAEAAALSGTVGLKSVRNAALRATKSLLERLRAYVQGVADDHAGSAAAIIEGAGMTVVMPVLRGKAILAVYDGRASGMVRLVAKAIAKEATYYWRMSADGGRTWKDLPPTLQAETKVSGLEPGKTYGFRFRATLRKMSTNWCDPIEFLVR
jgi:hypothetical protein